MSALPDVICPRHHAYPLRAHCRDCGIGMCELCTVDVPGVGQLCWECAGRRGGLHRRPRPRNGAYRRRVDDAPESTAVLDRFDARLDARGAPAPRDGLSRRLRAAGVDPAAEAYDEGQLLDDVEHLQDLAAAGVVTRRRWWRRR